MRGEKSRSGNEAVDVALYQVTDRLMGEEEVDSDEERIFEVPTHCGKARERKIAFSRVMNQKCSQAIICRQTTV